MICFSFDLDPGYKLQAPFFYGIIPQGAGARLAVFVFLFIFSACHIAIKIVGVALLAHVSALYLSLFLGSDFIFFIFFKVRDRGANICWFQWRVAQLENIEKNLSFAIYYSTFSPTPSKTACFPETDFCRVDDDRLSTTTIATG